jgi:glyoxylase-like metal-dependent hydrolase (beta-lactamase superfamily II)
MEIESGIHQITVGREPFAGFPPPNAFLVSGTESSVLIDAGWAGGDDQAQRMAAIADAKAPPVIAVLLTHRHPDHAGGALALHRALDVPLACHPLEREVIEGERMGGEAAVAQELIEGTRYDLGGRSVEIVFTPGHTLGCVAPYVPELGALFASDTVMGISTTVVRPVEGDLAQYAASLERMLEVSAKTIYTGHGPPVRDPDKRLRTLIEHRRAREEELLAALAGGDRGVDDLRDAIYGALAEPRKPLASAQVVSMLTKLAAEGLTADAGDGRWRLAASTR